MYTSLHHLKPTQPFLPEAEHICHQVHPGACGILHQIRSLNGTPAQVYLQQQHSQHTCCLHARGRHMIRCRHHRNCPKALRAVYSCTHCSAHIGHVFAGRLAGSFLGGLIRLSVPVGCLVPHGPDWHRPGRAVQRSKQHPGCRSEGTSFEVRLRPGETGNKISNWMLVQKCTYFTAGCAMTCNPHPRPLQVQLLPPFGLSTITEVIDVSL